MTEAELNRRFDHHPPRDPERVSEHQEVRDAAKAFAAVLATLPDGREKALAITKVEEALFWSNAAVARQDQ